MVYDDLSQCPGIELRFSYLEDDGKEHIGDYVGQIDLYIYDEEGKLVRSLQLDDSRVKSDPIVKLNDLDEGKYRAIAVGNMLEKTEAKDKDLVSKASIRTTDKDGKTDMLYIGAVDFEVKTITEPVTKILELRSQHVKVYVRVELKSDDEADKKEFVTLQEAKGGYRITIAEIDREVRLTDRQQSDKGVISSPILTEKDRKYFETQFFTLRFDEKDPTLELLLYNGESVAKRVNLADYIRSHQNRIKINTRQEAYLPLYFYIDPTTLAVTLEPWSHVDVSPII